MKQRVNVLEAEVRAVEEGLRAFHAGDGTFRVRSVSRPGMTWHQTVAMVHTPAGWRLKVSCDCESGTARPADAIPCLHAATVLRSLERRKLARWVGGLFAPVASLVA